MQNNFFEQNGIVQHAFHKKWNEYTRLKKKIREEKEKEKKRVVALEPKQQSPNPTNFTWKPSYNRMFPIENDPPAGLTIWIQNSNAPAGILSHPTGIKLCTTWWGTRSQPTPLWCRTIAWSHKHNINDKPYLINIRQEVSIPFLSSSQTQACVKMFKTGSRYVIQDMILNGHCQH